jgi:predicted dehydrogenase
VYNQNKKLKIGVLGVALIVPKALMNPLEHIDTAYAYGIAAREKQRAANFAKYFKIPKVYNDYQSLIDSDEIDSVYIPLANHLHYEWVIKCAKAKKHILVEKPICLSKDQLFEIKEVVEKNRVHLLEGIMVQHHPWQQKIIDMVNSDNLGKICSTKTEICFQSSLRRRNFLGCSKLLASISSKMYRFKSVFCYGTLSF